MKQYTLVLDGDFVVNMNNVILEDAKNTFWNRIKSDFALSSGELDITDYMRNGDGYELTLNADRVEMELDGTSATDVQAKFWRQLSTTFPNVQHDNLTVAYVK